MPSTRIHRSYNNAKLTAFDISLAGHFKLLIVVCVNYTSGIS